MRLIINIITLLILTSCNPSEKQYEVPAPPELEQPEPSNPITDTMKITIGDTSFKVALVDNATTTAFKAMLPMTFNMSDFNNNEKVASLPSSLATAPYNPRTIHTGDIMLYGSSSLVIFYETFSTSYSYTRIGRVEDVSKLRTELGAGSVTVKFELE